MRRALMILGFIAALAPASFGIVVSGDVWGVWSADNNPYEVVGDLRVPPDSALVILPGCYIDFRGYYEFKVDTGAVLHAVGTAVDSIFFTRQNIYEGWRGIRLLDNCDGSQLSYCIVEWGKAVEYPGLPESKGG